MSEHEPIVISLERVKKLIELAAFSARNISLKTVKELDGLAMADIEKRVEEDTLAIKANAARMARILADEVKHISKGKVAIKSDSDVEDKMLALTAPKPGSYFDKLLKESVEEITNHE